MGVRLYTRDNHIPVYGRAPIYDHKPVYGWCQENIKDPHFDSIWSIWNMFSSKSNTLVLEFTIVTLQIFKGRKPFKRLFTTVNLVHGCTKIVLLFSICFMTTSPLKTDFKTQFLGIFRILLKASKREQFGLSWKQIPRKSRTGKIVIDAIVSNPTLLVAQKRNYSWLGIPSIDGVLQKHFSNEEGIDNHTKIRRIAREQTAARMNEERDDAVREDAQMGHIVSNRGSNVLEGVDVLKKKTVNSLVFSMDEKLRWQDHHCMDAGVEFKLKRRKANGGDMLVAGITAKKRILEHSVSAAHA
ncbi:unnamed protein product [Lactuca saligna]|uniref:Uncharacterized protein n=1 Tax=Lactuca saligna TaxID=75948 RepID=A0AA35XZP5_LACSI|nr:unnamed protein product [Lactuca saligna]